jgi:hypothetical protein
LKVFISPIGYTKRLYFANFHRLVIDQDLARNRNSSSCHRTHLISDLLSGWRTERPDRDRPDRLRTVMDQSRVILTSPF